MNESDFNEITRVVFTRLSDQLRRVAEDLGQQPPSRSETVTVPEERAPTDERRAQVRREMLAELRRR